MTFQNIRPGRVMLAIVLIFVLSMGANLAVSTVYVLARFTDALDPNATPQEQEDVLQQEVDALMTEMQNGSDAVTRLMLIQWALAAVIALGVTYFVVRTTATDPAQAVGYGTLIGLGVLLIYSFCICGAVVNAGFKVVFLALIGIAGTLGGQWAGRNLKPAVTPEIAVVPGMLTASPRTSGEFSAETYYNMGVQAALGGRREEARQHFTHAVQRNPRYVEAWLQLANLSDTPEQAWNYVQQARMLAPNHPAVKQAVAIIWPRVSANAAKREPPRNEPPYSGGAQNDVKIPSTRLSENEHLPTPPSVEDKAGEEYSDEPPLSPPTA